jgi:phosphoribosylglycinamide formyltransferase 2
MSETTQTPEPPDTSDDESTDAEPAAQRDDRSSVMLLGSGELSRELTLAFQRLGREVVAVDRHANAPAHGVADRAAVVRMNDAEALTAIIERANPMYVVAESGVIAVDALVAAAERGLEVYPTPRSVRMSQDREGMRKLAADELGLPTVPFWFAGSVDELTAVAEHAGFPLVVKPIAGVPGEGESVLLRTEDVEAAWQRAVSAGRMPHSRVLAETVVEVDHEITLITVRTTGPTGPALHFCEPIGHRAVDSDLLEAWQPQALSAPALDAAKSIAARIVNALGGRGVFGVELLVSGDDVYFADIRTRPHDSGLVTLRSQRLSEFELHARAILGLHVDTIMISPGAAEVTYGGAESAPVDIAPENVNAVLGDALAVAESDARLFIRPDEGEPRRRLGLALATAPDVTTARDRVRRVTGVLRKLW